MAGSARSSGFQNSEEISTYAEKPSILIEDVRLNKVLLGEGGNTLPLGVLLDGKRLQKFELNPYTGDLELGLSKLHNQHGGRPGDILPQFLSVAVRSIGDYSLGDLAKELGTSKAGVFERMTLADALTILMRFRLENFGAEMQLSAKCQSCGHLNQDGNGRYTDLSSCECNVLQDYSVENFEISVANGYTAGEVTAKRFQLRPLRVYDLKRLETAQRKNTQVYSPEIELLFYAIVDVPEAIGMRGSQNDDRSGLSRMVAEDIYRKLPPRDRQQLQQAVVKINTFGMDMSVEMQCSQCGHEWKPTIPWRDLPSFLSFPID